MPGARDAGDRSGTERAAVHDRGVELVAAFRGEHRATAGVEHRIVFHEHDRRFDGIKRRAPFPQNADARVDRTR